MIEKFFKVTRKEKTIMGRKELLSLVERVDSNSSASPAEISFDEYIFDGSDEKKNVTQNDFVSLLKAAAKCKHLHSMSFPNDFLINEVTLEPIVDLFSNKHIREVKFNRKKKIHTHTYTHNRECILLLMKTLFYYNLYLKILFFSPLIYFNVCLFLLVHHFYFSSSPSPDYYY